VIVAAVAAVVVALLAALLIADRVAVIHAQGRIAARLGDRGFAARPQVTIAGFPFLTQLAARRLDKVVISAAGKKLGPVEVRRLDVTLHGIRARPGCDGRTASRLSGTALVGFAGLAGPAAAPGLLPGITLALPALPLAMTIQSVSITSQGLQLHLAGHIEAQTSPQCRPCRTEPADLFALGFMAVLGVHSHAE
jgi:hypothetical protein